MDDGYSSSGMSQCWLVWKRVNGLILGIMCRIQELLLQKMAQTQTQTFSVSVSTAATKGRAAAYVCLFLYMLRNEDRRTSEAILAGPRHFKSTFQASDCRFYGWC